MIPLEKLIPIEKNAREAGYETTILQGGDFVKFEKYFEGGRLLLSYKNNEFMLACSHSGYYDIKEFGEYVEAQKQLLEFARLMKECVDVKNEGE